jgi:hypothetical protein
VLAFFNHAVCTFAVHPDEADAWPETFVHQQQLTLVEIRAWLLP